MNNDSYSKYPSKNFGDADFMSNSDIDCLAQTLSPQFAQLLQVHFPGIELRVPKKMRRDHYIARKIGFENACRLATYAGGADAIQIPTTKQICKALREKQITGMIAAGIPRHDIAVKLGIHQRSLRRITAKLGLSGVSNAKPRSQLGLNAVSCVSNAPLTLGADNIRGNAPARPKACVAYGFSLVPTMEYLA